MLVISERILEFWSRTRKDELTAQNSSVYCFYFEYVASREMLIVNSLCVESSTEVFTVIDQYVHSCTQYTRLCSALQSEYVFTNP